MNSFLFKILVYFDRLHVRPVDSSVTVAGVRRSLARCYRTFTTLCQDAALLTSLDSSLPPLSPLAPPPVSFLPWTDIVHLAAMYQLSTLSRVPDMDSSVWYRLSSLEDWAPPSSWTRGLGRARDEERTVDTITEVINNSVSEARERSFVEASVHTEAVCSNPHLRDALKDEQKSSLRFERMLEEAIKDTSVPVIQPMKSPRTPKPNFLQSKTSPKKRKPTPSPTKAKTVRLDVDQKVDGLKVSVQLEMEENDRLEKMLQAALK